MEPIRIPEGTLIVVGDGSKALFLRNHGNAVQPARETEAVFEHDDAPTREQGTDRPGRRGDGAAGHRSALDQTDWHQLSEDRFAVTVADVLYRAAHAGRFDKLVVVAPPATLGVLRKAFHPEVQARIISEFPKDLSGHAIADIERHLAYSD